MPLTVVIPTHQTREMTLRCLAGVLAAGEVPPEVVVVDDGSTDGTAEAVRRAFPAVRLVRNDTTAGFTAAANRGVGEAQGAVVLLLNSDTEVVPGGVGPLLEAFRRHPRLGVAGARLLYPDGSPQWSHGREPGLLWCFALASGLGPWLGHRAWWRRIRGVSGSSRRQSAAYRPVGWVTGAALAFRREVWNAVGPLHEGFRFYGQDLDFCLRAKDAGWEVGVVDACVIVHRHGATIGVVEPAGQVSRQNPALLWRDLVHWANRRGGPRKARWVARSLAAGARLRLAGRRLLRPWRPASRIAEWRQEDRALAAGLAVLRDPGRPAGPGLTDTGAGDAGTGA